MNEYDFKPAYIEEGETAGKDADWTPPELNIKFDKKETESKAEKPKVEDKPQ